MEPLIEFFFSSAFVFHSYWSYIGKFSHFKNCFKINTFLAYCIFKAWIRPARERESRASDYLSQEIISALAFLWIYWNQFPCHSSFSLLLSLSFFIEDSPAFRNLVRANLVKRFTSFSMGSFKSVIRCFPFSITSIYSSHVSVLANWCVCVCWWRRKTKKGGKSQNKGNRNNGGAVKSMKQYNHLCHLKYCSRLKYGATVNVAHEGHTTFTFTQTKTHIHITYRMEFRSFWQICANFNDNSTSTDAVIFHRR